MNQGTGTRRGQRGDELWPWSSRRAVTLQDELGWYVESSVSVIQMVASTAG